MRSRLMSIGYCATVVTRWLSLSFHETKCCNFTMDVPCPRCTSFFNGQFMIKINYSIFVYFLMIALKPPSAIRLTLISRPASVRTSFSLLNRVWTCPHNLEVMNFVWWLSSWINQLVCAQLATSPRGTMVHRDLVVPGSFEGASEFTVFITVVQFSISNVHCTKETSDAAFALVRCY